jgi:hypothetical protein
MKKFEIQNLKHETNLKLEFPNVKNGFVHLNFGHSNLFRISNFDIRIL